MAKLTSDSTIEVLFGKLEQEINRLSAAVNDAAYWGRYAEVEALLDEQMVIARFISYSRNIVQ